MTLLQSTANSYDIKSQLILYVIVVFGLFASFLYAFIISQRKKLQHQKDMQLLHEQQQNQLIEAAIRSEETERHRIAEALHDEIGAILSSAKLHLQGIKLNTLDERDQNLYAKGKELLDDGIHKVRGISHNLHSSILKEFGLNEAVKDFMKKTVEGKMIECSAELDDNYKTKNAERDITIYRIVQELIHNILKHANASKLDIHSVYSGDNLELILQHNGVGLTNEQFEELRYKRNGLGLKNIQNRIILLKGSIGFAKKGDGYRINLNLPINQ